MRLDARLGDRWWYIWHCELVKQLTGVVWIDDTTNEYGVYRVDGPEDVSIETKKAKKIEIIPPSKTIFVNPIDSDAIDQFTRIGVCGNV